MLGMAVDESPLIHHLKNESKNGSLRTFHSDRLTVRKSQVASGLIKASDSAKKAKKNDKNSWKIWILNQ